MTGQRMAALLLSENAPYECKLRSLEDGAIPFEKLRAAGVLKQGTPKRTFVVRRPVTFREGDIELQAVPYDGFHRAVVPEALR